MVVGSGLDPASIAVGEMGLVVGIMAVCSKLERRVEVATNIDGP